MELRDEYLATINLEVSVPEGADMDAVEAVLNRALEFLSYQPVDPDGPMFGALNRVEVSMSQGRVVALQPVGRSK
jgi:hypothetical protein